MGRHRRERCLQGAAPGVLAPGEMPEQSIVVIAAQQDRPPRFDEIQGAIQDTRGIGPEVDEISEQDEAAPIRIGDGCRQGGRFAMNICDYAVRCWRHWRTQSNQRQIDGVWLIYRQ